LAVGAAAPGLAAAIIPNTRRAIRLADRERGVALSRSIGAARPGIIKSASYRRPNTCRPLTAVRARPRTEIKRVHVSKRGGGWCFKSWICRAHMCVCARYVRLQGGNGEGRLAAAAQASSGELRMAAVLPTAAFSLPINLTDFQDNAARHGNSRAYLLATYVTRRTS